MLPACTGDKSKSCQQEHPDIKEKKEKVIRERTWTSKEKSII
jgi:hypothetical protein